MLIEKNMVLKDEIKKLVELQKVDSRIYSLRKEKETALPAQLESLKNNFEEKKKGVETIENQSKQLQLKKKEKELDLATKEEGAKKLQGQLYQLKSNKEYQAKLTEIASAKADISVLEEEVIKVLDEIENISQKVKEEKTLLAAEEKNFKDEEAQLTAKIKSIENEIEELESKRKISAQDVNAEILDKYEKLLKTRSGLAIVPVDVNTENCGACNMRVTPQTINTIKMYKDLVLCENCVRILYIIEDVTP
jgi:predicted  nucleic acid-binding Zn-ribbon protein